MDSSRLLARAIPTLLFFIIIISFSLTSAVHGAPLPQDREAVYIVKLTPRPGNAQLAQALAAQHGAHHVYQAVFPGFAAPLSEQAAAALAANSNVESVEAAEPVTLDADLLPAGVDRIDAELAQLSWSGQGARVAVIDTGIDYNHPDLIDVVDRSLSRTLIGASSDGLDDHGHGTHVAGILAATVNDSDVLGVAPLAQLVSLKVFDASGSGTTAEVIAALDLITAHNLSATRYEDMIHVANLSLSAAGSDRASSFRDAFEATISSGCFVVVAAGNESIDAAERVPAAYDSVFTVSAMDPANDAFAWFSNYGADVDMTAPGISITSDRLGGGVLIASGTSMAAPHVSGAAALYVSRMLASLQRANATAEIRQALLGSAEALTMAGDPDGLNEPLVDAEALMSWTAPPPPPTPVMSVTGITYAMDKKTLVITLQISDGDAMAVAGASVDVSVHKNGVHLRSYVDSTDATGTMTIRIGGAKSGTYNVIINGISLDGHVYDAAGNALDPGFVL